MRKCNTGVKVLRKHENNIIRVRVELNRKMTYSGRIIYAVVVTNMSNGHHYLIKTFNRIMDAFNFYKSALA